MIAIHKKLLQIISAAEVIIYIYSILVGNKSQAFVPLLLLLVPNDRAILRATLRTRLIAAAHGRQRNDAPELSIIPSRRFIEIRRVLIAALSSPEPAGTATAAESKDEHVAEGLSELLRHEVVEYGVDGAVGVEEEAHRDRDVPVLAQRDEHGDLGADEHEQQSPDLERKEAHVEGDDDAHQHHDELLARLDVPSNCK